MPVQPTIFASKAEVRVYHALRSRWEPRFQIFPQLPLANLFGAPSATLTPAEREFYFKSSVDYTLADKNHRPLLSIEFDGIGHGYDNDGKYVEVRAVPKRKLKLDFKLRIARDNSYPFFVVSFEETKGIESGETLTILDGIIGRVLVKSRGNELAQQLVAQNQGLIDQLEHASRGTSKSHARGQFKTARLRPSDVCQSRWLQ